MITFTANKKDTELLVEKLGYTLIYSGVRCIYWIKDGIITKGEWNEISGSGIIKFEVENKRIFET